MSEVAMPSEVEIPAPDPREGKYVIFRLAHGEFGVAVHKVREVMEKPEITVVPNAAAFIAGVMNLRGKVIPVVDLRRIFDLPAEPSTARSCIMVVRATLADVEQVLGIVVDEVVEVLRVQSGDFLQTEDLEPMPEFDGLHTVPYLVGVAGGGEKTKLLLDIDEVLNHLDLHHAEAVPAAA